MTHEVIDAADPLADLTIREAHDLLERQGLRLCGRCSRHPSAFRRYLCTGCFTDLALLKRKRTRKELQEPLGHSTIHSMMVMGNV